MTIQLSATREYAREEYERYLGRFLRESPIVASRGKQGIADLLFGDPHDPALPEISEIIRSHLDQSQRSGYRYVHHLPEAREAAAGFLSDRSGISFDPDGLFLTTGAFAALSSCLQVIADRGAEVIYFSPPWFYYRSMIKAAGAVPRGIDLRPDDWSVPLELLEQAIGPQTCAILINSPHNPTGKVFADEELQAIANVVTEAGKRIGRVIPVISDEAYSRIVFDQPHAPGIAKYYPATIVIYTYGKTLLAPSLRLGYMALAPGFPEAEKFRRSFDAYQPIGGWLMPPCMLQRALPDLEKLCVNLETLNNRRRKLISALHAGGYNVIIPQGTFYMLVNSPHPDDGHYALQLAERGVLVLPGSTLETPGTFRLSFTASDEMIDQACSVFARGDRSD